MNPAANAGVSVGLGIAAVHVLAWLLGKVGLTVPENIQSDMSVLITAGFGYVLHTRGEAIRAKLAAAAATVAAAATDNAKVSTILLVLLATAVLPGCGTTGGAAPGQPAESTSIGAVAASVVIPAKTYPERVYRQTAFLAMESVVVSQRAVSDAKLAAQTLGLLQTALAQNKALRAEMTAAGSGRPAWFELHIGLAATSMVDVGVAVGIADAFDFTKLASLNPIEWVQFALGKIKEANSLYWMVTDTQAQLAEIAARGTGPNEADYAAIDAVLNQALTDLSNAAKPAGAPSLAAPVLLFLPAGPASAPLPSVSAGALS